MALGAAPSVLALLAASRIHGRAPPLRAVAAIALAGQTPEILGRAYDLETIWTQGPEMTLGLFPLVRSSTSLGAYFDLEEFPTPLQVIADEISPFTIWSAALAGVGFRVLTGSGWIAPAAIFLATTVLRAAARAGSESLWPN
jgi:hypothetical protein